MISHLSSLSKRVGNALYISGLLGRQNFSYLLQNLPPTMVYVRKEYITQFEDGFGELEEGVWVSVKMKANRAFLFETLFT